MNPTFPTMPDNPNDIVMVCAWLLCSFRKHYKSVSTPRKLILRCKMVPVLAIRWETRRGGETFTLKSSTTLELILILL